MAYTVKFILINKQENIEMEDEKKIADELHKQQKFSIAGAIGQAGGGGMLKGASPIPRLDQARNQLIEIVKQHCPDPSGALKSILGRRIKSSTSILENHLADPKIALVEILQALLDSDGVLFDFVRQVDMRWGEMYQERPHFQQPGQAPHQDDEYTHESVKDDLTTLLQRVQKNL
ncbi:MAG: hypothetical protein HQL68_09585 [Magnetococcales bacterium]|nr:hypothetical protein [Magnetococcales bacterium]